MWILLLAVLILIIFLSIKIIRIANKLRHPYKDPGKVDELIKQLVTDTEGELLPKNLQVEDKQIFGVEKRHD